MYTKKFKFERPLVESYIPPRDVNTTWVLKDDKKEIIYDIKKFINGKWTSIVEKDSPNPIEVPVEVPVENLNAFRNFLYKYLTVDLKWTKDDTDRCLDYLINDLYLGEEESWLNKVLTRVTWDNMRVGVNTLENWEVGSINSIQNRWRNDYFTGIFFPNLDYTGVENASRAWHSNYNCLFFPSMEFPDADNIDGTFFYDDCHMIQNLCFSKITSFGFNHGPFYLCNFRDSNKVTISFPVLDTASGVFLQGSFKEIPKIEMPVVKSLTYLFYQVRFNCTGKDIIKELEGINWSNVETLYWVFRQLSEPENAGNYIDLGKMNLSSLKYANWAFYLPGVKLILPDNLNLPEVLEASGILGSNDCITYIKKINCPKASLYNMLTMLVNLKRVDEIICPGTNDVEYLFDDTNNVEYIGKLTGLGEGFVVTDNSDTMHTLELAHLTNLKMSCIKSLFNSLGTVPAEVTNAKISLPEHIKEQLTDSLRSIATSKNWSISE